VKRRTVAPLLSACLLGLLPSCCPDSVQQVGVCEPLGDAQRLPSSRALSSVGIIDGHVLMLSFLDVDRTDTSDLEIWSQWFDDSLEPESEPLFLGTSEPVHRERLIRSGDALYAQMYLDPNGARPAGAAVDHTAIWRFQPGRPPTNSPLMPEWSRAPNGGYPNPVGPILSGDGLDAGPQGELPIVAVNGRVVAGVGGIPASCWGYYVNRSRILLFSESESKFFLWGDDPCQLLPNDLMVTNMQLVPVAGEIGVLFRLGDPGDDPVTLRPVGGHVTYARANTAFAMTVAPIPVAKPNWGHTSADPGYQPEAAAVVGDRILWNERHDVATSAATCANACT
jgi:hypothetical protein